MQIRKTRANAQHSSPSFQASTPKEIFSPQSASGRIDLEDLYTATRKEAHSLNAKLSDHFPREVIVKVDAGFSMEKMFVAGEQIA